MKSDAHYEAEAVKLRAALIAEDPDCFITFDGRVAADVASKVTLLAVKTLSNKRRDGTGPPFYATNRVWYRLVDLLRWMDERTHC